MNSQSNGVCLPAPLARKAERVLMIVAASYNVIMASVTLFSSAAGSRGGHTMCWNATACCRRTIPR